MSQKHASWLNMVEIEIGVLRGQCLQRRSPSRAKVSEIVIWEGTQRHRAQKWMLQPKKPAPKWAVPTQSQPAPKRTRRKSHNPCATVLARGSQNDIVANRERRYPVASCRFSFVLGWPSEIGPGSAPRCLVSSVLFPLLHAHKFLLAPTTLQIDGSSLRRE